MRWWARRARWAMWALWALWAGHALACPATPGCRCLDHSPSHWLILCDSEGGEVRATGAGAGAALQVECEADAEPPRLEARGAQLVRARCAARAGAGALLRRLGAEGARSLELERPKAPRELSRQWLGSAAELRRLALVAAGVRSLAADALEALPALRALELRGNRLRLRPHAFAARPPLRSLELARNEIAALPAAAFAELTELSVLSLRQNSLDSLPDEAFVGLKNLRELDLGSNRLTALRARTLAPLASVEAIDLFSNDLRSLPEGLFVANVRLARVKLSRNGRLRSVPNRSFANLPNLKEVYLDGCGLEAVPQELFEGSKAITNVSLSNNDIETLSDDVFKDQGLLLNLDLSYNRIRALSVNSFRGLKSLEYLNLRSNKLDPFPSVAIGSLVNLKYLQIEQNALEELPFDSFAKNSLLVKIEIANNSLRPSTSCIAFSGTSQLQFLNLSRNKFDTVCKEWSKMELLTNIDLSFNVFQNITSDDLVFGEKLAEVDFRHNAVTTVNGALRRPRLLLAHNPLRCDCELAPYVGGGDSNGGGECAAPRELAGRALAALVAEELECAVRDADCPSGCRCGSRSGGRGLVVRCPATATATATASAPPVRSNADLRLEPPAPERLELRGLPPALAALRISGLNVSSLRFFFHPSGIEELDLSGNLLQRLEPEEAQRVLAVTGRLWFGGNPLLCDCTNLHFLQILFQHKEKIADLDKLRCGNDNGAALDLERWSRAQCEEAGAGAGAGAGAAEAAAAAAAAGALLALAAAAAWRRRRGARRVRLVCAREDAAFVARWLEPELSKSYSLSVLLQEGGAGAGAGVVSVSAGGGPPVQVAVRAEARAGGATLDWEDPWFWDKLRGALPARSVWPLLSPRTRPDKAALIGAPPAPAPAPASPSRLGCGDNDGYCDGVKINPHSVHSEV